MGRSYIYTYFCSNEFNITFELTTLIYTITGGFYLSEIRWLKFLDIPIVAEMIITSLVGLLLLLTLGTLKEIIYKKLFQYQIRN